MQSNSSRSKLQTSIRFIGEGIAAEGHTPVYKMHRYFARRPHNVFRHLIEFYTNPGDVLLDCFCGGGVTLFEGLAAGRRIVAVDLNPLATFVSDCQTTIIPIQDYRVILSEVWDNFNRLTKEFYSTDCRKCHRPADVRWFELAYIAKCKECGKETSLSNENKASKGEVSNGFYRCSNCGSIFSAVGAERKGYALISVTYRCSCTQGRQKALVDEADRKKMENFEKNFDKLVEDNDLWYPRDKIPLDWDRQLEDGLSRKSVHRFSDLFTKRSLFFNAYLFKCFRRYKNQVSSEMYKMLIFTFSAILRYTNSMTFSATGWMDGRPISWDKHAYWIPNQFVEVNPLEYLEKRRTAIISGLKFQQSKLRNIKKVDSYTDLKAKKGTHIIWTLSSTELPIPDGEIDAIVTDPPYGSNVQYGELAYFWLVWLRDELKLPSSLIQFEKEILVHRRKQSLGHKTYDSYSDSMKKVFSECFRVLKPNGALVFTFNSKDLKAWYAVIKAAIKSGFYLDRRGVVYQSTIENYKNTAHTRYARSLHGDFIFTFYKSEIARAPGTLPQERVAEEIKKMIRMTVENYLHEREHATTNELYATIMPELTQTMAIAAYNDIDFSRLNELLNPNDLDSYFSQFLKWDDSEKAWCMENLGR
jgi:adenine-specific DNA methylase